MSTPVNRHPQLVCEGSCSKPNQTTHTPHTFKRSNVVHRHGSVDGIEQLFTCDACATERRYGYDAQGT